MNNFNLHQLKLESRYQDFKSSLKDFATHLSGVISLVWTDGAIQMSERKF